MSLQILLPKSAHTRFHNFRVIIFFIFFFFRPDFYLPEQVEALIFSLNVPRYGGGVHRRQAMFVFLLPIATEDLEYNIAHRKRRHFHGRVRPHPLRRPARDATAWSQLRSLFRPLSSVWLCDYVSPGFTVSAESGYDRFFLCPCSTRRHLVSVSFAPLEIVRVNYADFVQK